MNKRKKKVGVPVDESFDSSMLSPKEKEEGYEAMRAFKAERISKRTKEDDLKIRMLQLKYLIEDYIQSDRYDSKYSFAYFLREYIQRQNKKNSEFAKEISVSAVELSQLVNNHRDPNLKIIVRLEAHSNKNFPAIMWFSLYSKDKSVELIQNDELRESERKYVKKVLQFSF